MSPFRVLPQVELGPLQVGLAGAVALAITQLPLFAWPEVEPRARALLSSLAGLEATAHRAFRDPRSIHWLRRVLVAASAPDLHRSIPDDVRGRGELLLAREIAAYQGAALTRESHARREVALLLVEAAGHLDDPTPAHRDLAALEQSTRVFVTVETSGGRDQRS